MVRRGSSQTCWIELSPSFPTSREGMPILKPGKKVALFVIRGPKLFHSPISQSNVNELLIYSQAFCYSYTPSVLWVSWPAIKVSSSSYL